MADALRTKQSKFAFMMQSATKQNSRHWNQNLVWKNSRYSRWGLGAGRQERADFLDCGGRLEAGLPSDSNEVKMEDQDFR